MRILVTGSRGQLGRALERVAAKRSDVFVGCDLPELDITDAAAVHAAVREAKPDAVINCAAFTAVDAAEVEAQRALAVNGTAVEVLASAADAVGAVLVQISTDYVFDGTARRPYREDDPLNPRSVYGRTKLAGERAAVAARRHLVARTAWLFGEGRNFVAAICKQIESGASTLRVVGDQRGCPTYAEDLAGVLASDRIGRARNGSRREWRRRELVRVRRGDRPPARRRRDRRPDHDR